MSTGLDIQINLLRVINIILFYVIKRYFSTKESQCDDFSELLFILFTIILL